MNIEENDRPAFTYAGIAKMIDHSLLQPILTDAELEADCRLARDYEVASVCIKPYALERAVGWLAGSTVAVGTTVGFPHGGHTTAIKVAEAEQAIREGARELDMVVNIGKVLSNDWSYVAEDICAVVEVTYPQRVLLKVIFENCYLTNEQKERLCRICNSLPVNFIKTSTGYGTGGAVDEDLRLMRQCSPGLLIKAAGGVRTFARVLALREMGIRRIGCTATKAILDECKARLR
jgi:deoxyribose-phosphate aldolase